MTSVEEWDLVQWLKEQKAQWQRDSEKYLEGSNLAQAKACEYAANAVQKVIEHILDLR